MGNKKRQGTNSVSQNKQNDLDVKSNLRKLNKTSSASGFPSNYNYSDFSNNSSEVIASNGFTNGFEQTTNLEIKNLQTKLNSDISGLKDKVYETKDNLNSKILSEIDVLKRDFEIKLEKKFDEKIFLLAVGVLVTIAGIIGSFSYYPMITDVKDLQDKNIQIKDSINKMNSRIDKVNSLIKNTKR